MIMEKSLSKLAQIETLNEEIRKVKGMQICSIET